MWQTNLKILLIVVGTLGLYTLVASSIPQVASEVPEELTFSGEVKAEDLVRAGEQLFNGAGTCTACHGLGTRAPNLLTDYEGEGTIGQRCGRPGVRARLQGLSPRVAGRSRRVRRVGLHPDGVSGADLLGRSDLVARGVPAGAGGEVTVTGADMASVPEPENAEAGGTTQPGPAVAASQTTDPRQLLQENMCLGCHVIDGTGPPARAKL